MEQADIVVCFLVPDRVAAAEIGAMWIEAGELWLLTHVGPFNLDSDPSWWSRKGVPPKVTLIPAALWIQKEKYHAFLMDGVLAPCGCETGGLKERRGV